jgi:crotonobetainyl-CoA:carnitine CoA-transferase CaiB-like acyl-CoA transferase
LSAAALADLRTIELAGERSALAGKLLADMGADVVVIEPPAGAAMRAYAPFVDDAPDPEKSLYFWHYHTSKRGVTLDLDSEHGRSLLLRLVADADVLIESEAPERLTSLGLQYSDLARVNERLIHVSVTPFGPSGPRAHDPATDLTLLAGGGPAWSCGYDDHALPPVRGGGNQAHHTASHFAVLSLLVALLAREQNGRGQHIHVNMHAAANVTTEAASYDWLVAKSTVQRQTGRHAAPRPSLPTQVICADGKYVNTGLPPRRGVEFAAVLEWLEALGLRDGFPEAVFLEQGAERERIDLFRIAESEELIAIFSAGREAMNLIAANVSAYDFFVGAQQRGLAAGIVYAPEEVLADPHFVARGFPVEVEHPELGRAVTYPGAPYRFERTPWRISRRAPRLGEHNDEVYGALGFDPAELERLRAERVI